ncbi:hypothetical protein KKH05_02315 [Patescibacteria group bacterium]|nr:hypothetical protein [Patescibacteria group bacterium]
MKDFVDSLESLAPGFLWMGAIFVLAFTTLISLTLSYHWKEYSIDSKTSAKMFKGYLVVAGILVVAMILSLILYLY